MEIQTNEINTSKSCDEPHYLEHYLRHILLLEQASPIALKAIIEREEKKYGKDIGILLNENRHTIKTHYETEFFQLFQEDDVNADTDKWDTLQLCAVTLALFKSGLTNAEVKAIQCIYDQRKDIEHNGESTSLTYNSYEEKQNLLHEQLLELITLIDDRANHDCKRMVISIKLKSMKLSKRQINKITWTNDFKSHLEIAIDLVTETDITGEEKYLKLHTNGKMFTEALQNKTVFINDSAILACKLNIPTDENVEWRKDNKPVTISNNLMVVSNKENHWLAISRASLEDTGQYTCVCGNISTSADLTVIDEELELSVDSPNKIDVIENETINIKCKVNRLTRKPDWRHKGKVLQSSGRKVILAKGTKHELMITNVTLQDEGEYTVDFENVSSKTTVQIQGETDLIHRKQITQELYRNWVRGTLALKYLKIGLEGFCDKAVNIQHNDLMKTLGNTCNTCTVESLLPHEKNQCPHKGKRKCLCTKNHNKSRQMCPNGRFCGHLYDEIVSQHRFQDPLFTNMDVQKWSSDPWSVATCFINTAGYKGKQSAKDVDCSGLLSLCINNINIENMLGKDIINGENDAFTKARKSRNDILHNPNYELSENQLNIFIKEFKEVLEIKDENGHKPLKGEPGVENALYLLDMLQQNQIDINLEDEIGQLREHGMVKLEEKYQTAKEQHELKLQLIKQQIKDQENELRLMLNLRYAGQHKEEFLLELQISVIAENGEKSLDGNQRVYEVMKDYIQNDDGSNDTPLNHLLNYIKAINKCHIVDISSTSQSSTEIHIQCLTSEAMENFLKAINSNNFQQVLFKIRRWLYVRYGIKSHDIIANCSSNAIEKAKQRLHFTEVIRTMTCAEHQHTQCTLYCPDHDTLLCTACRESRHGTCLGIKQVTSERSYVEQKRRLDLKKFKGTYNVRIGKSLINRDNNDQFQCSVTSMCMLPNSEVLLADKRNKRLKKLNSSYKVISHCDVPEYPYNVCYIGNDTAVAGLRDHSVQYVNLSGNINLRRLVRLSHKCLGLACHGNTLYINSGDTIYKYDNNCEQKHSLYHYRDNLQMFCKQSMSVSDNDERLYFISNTGLTTIDAKGNHLLSEQFDGYDIYDTCIAGEGIVLVLGKTNTLHQLDYTGKKQRTENNMTLCLLPSSMCFDRQRCRLIVGCDVDNINVYKCEILPS